MSLKFRVVQDKREGSKKLFYGKAIHINTVETDALAERIQRNCSMKRSDVVAVLAELTEVINDELQSSNKVHLNGLGYLYLGLRTVGAASSDDFTVQENVKGVRVNFLAEGKRNVSGTITRTFTNGIKLERVRDDEDEKK